MVVRCEMKITLTQKQVKQVVEYDKQMQMVKAWVSKCQSEVQNERKNQNSNK